MAKNIALAFCGSAWLTEAMSMISVMYSYRCFIIIFLSGLSACHIWIISSA